MPGQNNVIHVFEGAQFFPDEVRACGWIQVLRLLHAPTLQYGTRDFGGLPGAQEGACKYDVRNQFYSAGYLHDALDAPLTSLSQRAIGVLKRGGGRLGFPVS